MPTENTPENPPAFPHVNPNYDGNWDKEPQREGMTLRDYFAAAALTGLLAGQFRESSFHNMTELPEEALKIADAMLSARKGAAHE